MVNIQENKNLKEYSKLNSKKFFTNRINYYNINEKIYLKNKVFKIHSSKFELLQYLEKELINNNIHNQIKHSNFYNLIGRHLMKAGLGVGICSFFIKEKSDTPLLFVGITSFFSGTSLILYSHIKRKEAIVNYNKNLNDLFDSKN